MAEFSRHDRVRLRRDVAGLNEGAEGVVVAVYRDHRHTYFVRFGDEVVEVPADDLELAETDSSI